MYPAVFNTNKIIFQNGCAPLKRNNKDIDRGITTLGSMNWAKERKKKRREEWEEREKESTEGEEGKPINEKAKFNLSSHLIVYQKFKMKSK